MGASALPGKGSLAPDSDIHITLEDQQKINKFARHNAKLNDVKDEVKDKQNDVQNLEYALEELMMMDDADSEQIPFLIGEVFFLQNMDETQEYVEKAKVTLNNSISKLNEEADELTKLLSGLKSQLYAKFGDHINLEAEED